MDVMLDVTLSWVLWQSPQHAGFSQRLQPPPSPPVCATQSTPGLLLSFSQSQVQALVDTATYRQGMGWDHSSTGKLCVHVSFPSSCQGATWRKAAPTQMGTPPPLPLGVPKMPGGVLGIFKWLKLQPNTPQDK